MFPGCARLLKQMDRPDVTIAVDGSVFKFHPRYKLWMNRFIKLLAPNHKVRSCCNSEREAVAYQFTDSSLLNIINHMYKPLNKTNFGFSFNSYSPKMGAEKEPESHQPSPKDWKKPTIKFSYWKK